MVNQQAAVLFGFFLLLFALGRTAPQIVAVANALVPLLVIAAIVIALLRILWFITNRYG